LVADEDGNIFTFRSDSSSNEDIPDLKLRNDFNESSVENLINLPHLHEPAILFSLQIRYGRDEIYTYTGPILIAVNPFKKINLYSPETLQIYYNSGLLRSQGVDVGSPLPPHVYAIADAAYRDMMNSVHGSYGGSSTSEKKGPKGGGTAPAANQSILISGESGAGKTESTKIVLKYLTTVGNSGSATASGGGEITPGGRGDEGSIMDKVLQSNPILEAFGNAKTLRNDNSSRFGKFIELSFSRRGVLIGGSISTYLLEKVRLPWQQYGERNFHIFYQLTAGANEEEKKKWSLKSIRDYEYTTKGAVFTLDGIDDSHEFKELKRALSVLNFSLDDQVSLFDLVAGILHLGQFRFQSTVDGEGEGSKILDEPDVIASLNAFSSLCGLTVDDIIYTLSVRVITARSESYEKKLSAVQANDARDALAKAIYGKLFDWIVMTINLSIKVAASENVRATIGVLDIFGFECFTSNSFEQLCINYTNETLQQQFNQYIFKLEQQEYQREKIEWSFIEFPDNKDCLELIEHKTNGILAMLDDECRLPASSDEKFAGRIYKAYATNARFSATAPQKRNFKFCIHHYAGPVEYSTMTFVDKNKDELPKEASSLLASSSIPLLRSLFDGSSSASVTVNDHITAKQQSSTSQSGGGAAASGKALSSLNSVGSQFKEQLHKLMDSIYATSPHYIRCLKPNDKNIRDNFNRLRITEQLRYGGVLEAVRVARSGFPVRLIHSEFFSRYRMLLSVQSVSSSLPRFLNSSSSSSSSSSSAVSPNVKNGNNLKELCEQFLSELWTFYFAENSSVNNSDKNHNKFSKIGNYRKNLSRHNVQVGLTKVFLRKEAHDVLESLRFKVLFIAATSIQSIYRCYLVRSKYRELVLASLLLQRVVRGMFARSKARFIRHTKAAVRLQSAVRSFIASQKFLRFKYATVLLQASFRRYVAMKSFGHLREARASLALQSIVRMKLAFKKYQRYRKALTVLQCRYRKVLAIRLLKRLRLEAKDLGKLKQSNDALKAEIDEIKMKAAHERERLREESEQKAKELAAEMKKAEEERTKVLIAKLQAKLEEEQRMREEAERKNREMPPPPPAMVQQSPVVRREQPTFCQNCEDLTNRYNDALKKIFDLEALLEKERAEIRHKERAFLKENSLRGIGGTTPAPVISRRSSSMSNSTENSPKPPGIAFIPPPTLRESSTSSSSFPRVETPSPTQSVGSVSSSIVNQDMQQEFNKMRHANHVLEQEVSRLRKLSLEQQALLESRSRTHSRDLNQTNDGVPPQHPPPLRRSSVGPGASVSSSTVHPTRLETRKSIPQHVPPEVVIKSSQAFQAWDSEDESSESESTVDIQGSAHSNAILANAAVTQTYEKNLEVWKNEFYDGYKVKFWEVYFFCCFLYPVDLFQ
jgi:myosin-5